ncbi:MAG: hypothetical protein CVU42_00125 [Chloroflexi bacterium HGW-Chloroflexi-4]|jgi:hypothetical protein|nr:MAG: hypothetical protein CVU42_00125 [Chloroflexi bacterium HGW-Chloroflexi-4]
MNHRITVNKQLHLSINTPTFSKTEFIPSVNWGKCQVYLRFLQQSGDYADDYLSDCKVHLIIFANWLGETLLSDIQSIPLSFLCSLDQLNIDYMVKLQILASCQRFLLWAISIYGEELRNLSIGQIINLDNT